MQSIYLRVLLPSSQNETTLGTITQVISVIFTMTVFPAGQSISSHNSIRWVRIKMYWVYYFQKIY